MLGNIARSGMNASRVLQANSANNVANINTDGFQAKTVSQESVEGGGTDVSEGKVKTDKTPSPPDPKPSNTNIVEESVTQVEAKESFSFNAGSYETQDEMIGTLMDVTG